MFWLFRPFSWGYYRCQQKICKRILREYHILMNILLSFIWIVVVTLFLLYGIAFFFLRSQIQRKEHKIVELFLAKIAKIPALIEVMRPYVVDDTAFATITSLHSETMVQRYVSIYDLLENNARIQNEFLFLMKLSMRIPELQKDEYFLYIRDFIIRAEKDIHASFIFFDTDIVRWNRFIKMKNTTLVGFFLPWGYKTTIWRH